MSTGPGTSRIDPYVFSPSISVSCGLIGTTVYPCSRYARTARLPNFCRSVEAPMTATTLPISPNYIRDGAAADLARGRHAGHLDLGLHELENPPAALAEELHRCRIR